jgi:Family of unknown function (DUF6318)
MSSVQAIWRRAAGPAAVRVDSYRTLSTGSTATLLGGNRSIIVRSHPRRAEMRAHRIATTMLAGALMLTAAACQGDSPKPSPVTTTPVASPTPTPTPTAAALPDFTKWQDKPANLPVPPMPAAAKQHTKAGSVAFGTYFMALVNYTLLTGRGKPLLTLGTKNCEACKSIVASLVKTLANGASYRGDPRYKSSMIRNADISRTDAGVDIETRSGAIQGKTRTGKVSKVAEDHIGVVLRLKSVDRGWQISDLSIGNL